MTIDALRNEELPRLQLSPVGDRIIVREGHKDQFTKGGIVIPDASQETVVWGAVLAVGPGRVMDDGTRLEMPCERGRYVLWGKYAGVEIILDEIQYLILRENDILGQFDEDWMPPTQNEPIKAPEVVDGVAGQKVTASEIMQGQFVREEADELADVPRPPTIEVPNVR